MPARPPHIVHVVPALFGDVLGGAERYALELARSMARRVPTTLLTFGTRPREMMLDRLRVCVLRNWTPIRRLVFDPCNPLMMRMLSRATLVHCHQPETMMASIAVLYAKASGTPIVATHLGGSGYGLHQLFSIDSWFRAHLHISEFSRRHFGHASASHASVVLGGVDTERFSVAPEAERGREVLFVGRWLPHKGLDYLVDAVDRRTPLTVMGSPQAHASAFVGRLRAAAAGKTVTFVERPDDDAVVAAYRRAMCLVLPSVHRTSDGAEIAIPELLGQTVIEAMACGTPVIASNVTSLPELIEDGVTGFVVPPNDSSAIRARIEWLSANPDSARAMGTAARSAVLRRFTWDRVVDRCFDAYARHAGCGFSVTGVAAPGIRGSRRRLKDDPAAADSHEGPTIESRSQ
ncbi:MAG: glycosyltransferase family 4 protein [Vicinamibacterales bacterium]